MESVTCDARGSRKGAALRLVRYSRRLMEASRKSGEDFGGHDGDLTFREAHPKSRRRW